MANPSEKNISAYVELEVAKTFHQQCEQRKQFKRHAIEAAIRSWNLLSAAEQNALITNESNLESRQLYLRSEIEKALVEYGLIEAKGHARPPKQKLKRN